MQKIKVLRKNFIINLIFLLSLNVLIKPFWIFGVERSVQNIVGAEEFGLYFSLFNFSLLLNILLDLGITNFNNRNISQNPALLTKHVSNIVSLKLLLAIFYAILTLSIALIVGYDERQFRILSLLIVNQFLLSLILYLRSNLSGLHLFKTDSFVSVLDRFLMIILCSILIWGNVTSTPFKIEWFVLIQTFSYLLTALVAFILVLRKTKFFKLNFDFRFFRIFLYKSYPYALLILLMSFYNRIDSVMLERLLPNGKEQAGIYAQAYRILEAASMYPYLFSILLLPMFARMIKKKENILPLIKLSFLLVIIPAIILFNICITHSEDIMDLMYVEHVDSSSTILHLLIIGFSGISTTYIFGTLLTANGNLRYLNIMASFGMLLNVVLNFILIPKYNVLGAAVSSMTTQIFTALSQVFIAKKVFDMKIDYKLIVSLIIFVGVSFFISKTLSIYVHHWIKEAFLTGILCLILAFVTGLFKINAIFDILKEKSKTETKI